MKRVLIALTLLAVCVQTAAACPITVGHGYAATYAAPVAVVKKVVAEVIPVAVFAPVAVATYSAAYVAPPVAAAPAPAKAAAPQPGNAEVLKALQELSQRLQRLEQRAAPAPAPVPQPQMPKAGVQAPAPAAANAVAILAAKCATCHDSTNAEAKGKGFVMFQGGSLVALTDRQQLHVLRRVDRGTMPPKEAPGLTPEETQVVGEYFLGAK